MIRLTLIYLPVLCCASGDWASKDPRDWIGHECAYRTSLTSRRYFPAKVVGYDTTGGYWDNKLIIEYFKEDKSTPLNGQFHIVMLDGQHCKDMTLTKLHGEDGENELLDRYREASKIRAENIKRNWNAVDMIDFDDSRGVLMRKYSLIDNETGNPYTIASVKSVEEDHVKIQFQKISYDSVGEFYEDCGSTEKIYLNFSGSGDTGYYLDEPSKNGATKCQLTKKLCWEAEDLCFIYSDKWYPGKCVGKGLDKNMRFQYLKGGWLRTVDWSPSKQRRNVRFPSDPSTREETELLDQLVLAIKEKDEVFGQKNYVGSIGIWEAGDLCFIYSERRNKWYPGNCLGKGRKTNVRFQYLKGGSLKTVEWSPSKQEAKVRVPSTREDKERFDQYVLAIKEKDEKTNHGKARAAEKFVDCDPFLANGVPPKILKEQKVKPEPTVPPTIPHNKWDTKPWVPSDNVVPRDPTPAPAPAPGAPPSHSTPPRRLISMAKQGCI